MYLMNQEVFVIFPDYNTIVDIVITKGLNETLDYLKMFEPEEYFETKVLHGVIAPADILPSDMLDNDCALIVLIPGVSVDGLSLRGTVIETDVACNPSFLAKEIEDLIDGADTALAYPPVIEDVFVLYGYELELGLCINMDTIDEEKSDSCKKVVGETLRIREGVS